MQERVPQFSLARRWLFPYTGEMPLTREQRNRVIITWAVAFPTIMTVGTLPFVVAFGSTAPWQRVALLLFLIFLCGAVLFGAMACFVVVMLNRSARVMQQQKELLSIRTDNPSGGRYGS